MSRYFTETQVAKGMMQLKKCRKYLIDHPGSTSEEVNKAGFYGLMTLQGKKLAYWKRVDGIVRWYAKPMETVTKEFIDYKTIEMISEEKD